MKKMLFIFLISGWASAQDVTYSVEEIFTKIVQSKTLSPSGKITLMGYLEDMNPIQFEVHEFSEMLCKEESDLFIPSQKSCEGNLVLFFSNNLFEKAATIEAWGNASGEAGGKPTFEVGIKVVITIK